MRKYLLGILAVGLMGGIENYGPTVCDDDPGYRVARILLDRGDKAFLALKLRVKNDDELLRALRDLGSDKAIDAKSLHAVDDDYLKGIALLGRTYRLNEEGVIDDTGQGLSAADDMDRLGQTLWATQERQGILGSRLSMFREGHACSGR
jgi:hypothetical protein